MQDCSYEKIVMRRWSIGYICGDQEETFKVIYYNGRCRKKKFFSEKNIRGITFKSPISIQKKPSYLKFYVDVTFLIPGSV